MPSSKQLIENLVSKVKTAATSTEKWEGAKGELDEATPEDRALISSIINANDGNVGTVPRGEEGYANDIALRATTPDIGTAASQVISHPINTAKMWGNSLRMPVGDWGTRQWAPIGAGAAAILGGVMLYNATKNKKKVKTAAETDLNLFGRPKTKDSIDEQRAAVGLPPIDNSNAELGKVGIKYKNSTSDINKQQKVDLAPPVEPTLWDKATKGLGDAYSSSENYLRDNLGETYRGADDYLKKNIGVGALGTAGITAGVGLGSLALYHLLKNKKKQRPVVEDDSDD